MTILRDLLAELKSDDSLEKLRMMCDQIFEEEKENIKNIAVLPKGPNIILVLEVPGRMKGEVAFLALERDVENTFLAVLLTTSVKEIAKSKSVANEVPSTKRMWAMEIKDTRPEMVLTEYAKKYKFLRGE